MLKKVLFFIFVFLILPFLFSQDISIVKINELDFGPIFSDSNMVSILLSFESVNSDFVITLQDFECFSDCTYNIGDSKEKNFIFHRVNLSNNDITLTVFNAYKQISFTIPTKDGSPEISALSFFTASNPATSQSFTKDENVLLSFTVSDNTDDFAGKYIACDIELDGVKLTTLTGNDSESYDFTYGLGKFEAGSTHTAEITCYDNEESSKRLSASASKSFSIEEEPITFLSVSISPEIVYNSTNVSCNAELSDSSKNSQISYEWYLNNTKVSDSKEYNCAECKANDNIYCRAKYLDITKDSSPIIVSNTINDLEINSLSLSEVNEPISFSANLSYNGSSDLSYSWDFGDGSTANGKEVTHSYSEEGTYLVTLTVSDGLNTATKTKQISIYAPSISIIWQNKKDSFEHYSIENIKVSIKDSFGNKISKAKASISFNGMTYNLEEKDNFYEAEIYVEPYFKDDDLIISVESNSIKEDKSYFIKVDPVIFDIDYNIYSSLSKNPEFVYINENIERIELCVYAKGKKITSLKDAFVFINDNNYQLIKKEDCFYRDLNYIVDKDIEIRFFLQSDNNDFYDNSFKISAKNAEFDFNIVALNAPDELALGQDYNLHFKLDKAFKVYYDSKLLVPDDNSVYTINFKAEKKYIPIVIDKNGIKKYYFFNVNIKTSLKIEVLNPKEDGSYSSRHLKIALYYPNNEAVKDENIYLLVNDENTFFKRDGNVFVSESYIPFFGNYKLNIKGSDRYGNKISFSNIYTLSPFFKLDTWIWLISIFVFFILSTLIIWRIKKIVKSINTKESIEDYEKELETVQKTLSQLTKDFFQQKISQEEYKKRKSDLVQREAVLKSKIDLMKKSIKKKDYNPIYSIHKESAYAYNNEVDRLVEKLRKVRHKYKVSEIKLVLEKEGYPEEVIKAVIKRLY